REMSYACSAIVRNRATEVLFADFFMGYCLDHIRARDEHIRTVLHHDVEVGNSGTVNSSAGTWSHDAADLGNDSASERISQKDIGVTAKTDYALLDARPTGIVQANHRRPHLHRQIEHLTNLF